MDDIGEADKSPKDQYDGLRHVRPHDGLDAAGHGIKLHCVIVGKLVSEVFFDGFSGGLDGALVLLIELARALPPGTCIEDA